MKKGEEFARHGFELLVKRSDPENFFDALSEAGFFSPSNNPGPRPSTQPGFVQVPFWTALNYLDAVAKRSQVLEDLNLAEKILHVIRTVSNFGSEEGSAIDNYHTFWKFAEILGSLPLKAVSIDDINLVPRWLVSKFDRGLVGRELSSGLLSRLLDSNDESDIEKACILLEHCTAITKPHVESRKEFVTVVDDFWLKELIKRHAKAFGIRSGNRAVHIFEARLKYLYRNLTPDFTSTLRRPAVEDSDQNLDWHGPDNRFVEGLRDTLLIWLATNNPDATQYVAQALNDEFEIIRRIALHVVAERYELLQSVFEQKIEASLFSSAHRHELYRLLQLRFGQFSEGARRNSVEAIRRIPISTKGEDTARRLKRTQRDWLTAIQGSGYEPADTWFKELQEEKALGTVSEHPDFLSFHESRWGPGPTPFGGQSLLAYAEDGSLIDKLNGFEQVDDWNGPTIGGLIEELRSIVAASPEVFVSILSSFHAAKLPFKYAVLNGFKSALDVNNKEVDWQIVWPKLLAFMDELISTTSFWEAPSEQDDSDRLPTRNWLTALAADFLSAGTKHDETSYAPDLLPIGWKLISALLSKVPADDSPSASDPMTHALNTAKGRIIDALVNHALRACRIAAKTTGSTLEGWSSVCSAFDDEISKCRDSNFEFSTLMGAYLANLDYMSHDWLTKNISQIFPSEFPRNFVSAVDGLAYATPTRPIYKLLAGQNVFLRALDVDDQSPIKHERIVEWISLSYLWGDEALDSPTVSRLFKDEEYIHTAISFFWQIRGDKLSDEQKEKVFRFWEVCVEWARAQKTTPARLISHLARLAVYVKAIESREKALLLFVAPHVHTEYNFDAFVGNLSRGFKSNPGAVSEILMRAIEADTPSYDYEDKLKRLIQDLAKLGFKREAIQCVEKLGSNFPGKIDLYKSL